MRIHDVYSLANTECPTHYRTRHFFNNFTTNENIATKFKADLPHCVRNVKEKNVLLFKFRCNIFICVRIIKEKPGSVASGTPCIFQFVKVKYDAHVELCWRGESSTRKGSSPLPLCSPQSAHELGWDLNRACAVPDRRPTAWDTGQPVPSTR